MYNLYELTSSLKSQVNEVIDSIDDQNRSWILNYIWAVSRCEKQKYHWLGELLYNFDDRKVLDWILFVPIQMPDVEFATILDKFLECRGASIDGGDTLILTARALAAIERQHPKRRS